MATGHYFHTQRQLAVLLNPGEVYGLSICVQFTGLSPQRYGLDPRSVHGDLWWAKWHWAVPSGSAAARLLKLWVRIPPEAWVSAVSQVEVFATG